MLACFFSSPFYYLFSGGVSRATISELPPTLACIKTSFTDHGIQYTNTPCHRADISEILRAWYPEDQVALLPQYQSFRSTRLLWRESRLLRQHPYFINTRLQLLRIRSHFHQLRIILSMRTLRLKRRKSPVMMLRDFIRSESGKSSKAGIKR